MDRFLKQFSLGDGYYGQNYIWKKGVDDRLFTRGHGWVLEGLLSCIRATGEENYKKEAKKLIENLMEIQKPDGSFSYLMGYGRPKRKSWRKLRLSWDTYFWNIIGYSRIRL